MLVMFMDQRYILQNNLTSSEVFYVAVYDNAIFLASFHKLYHVGIQYPLHTNLEYISTEIYSLSDM